MTSLDIAEEVDRHFNKIVTIKDKNDSYTLPESQELFKSNSWIDDDLQTMKYYLNGVKSKLDNFDLEVWHKHTTLRNKAGDVVQYVKSECKGELITQAWCKFFEVVSTYPLVPLEAIETKVLTSIHLCEAPGAFITSLKHFLALRYPHIHLNWIGSTLNPYFESNSLNCMITDDRLIMNTLDKWFFGSDGSGDIFNVKIIEEFRQLIKKKQYGPVLLVTADGSIDCHENPGEQEEIVSPLHYCEAITAISLLSKGGSFLLKVFTFFECSTICLMYLLSCVFESVNAYKPATSKEGNSEVYIVCLNFLGYEIIEPYIHKLLDFYDVQEKDKAMFPIESIPDKFMEKIKECAKYFSSLQAKVIEDNIFYFKRNDELKKKEDKKVARIKGKVKNTYISKYNVLPISEKKFVCGFRLKPIPQFVNDLRTNKDGFCQSGVDFLEYSSYQNELLRLKVYFNSLPSIWQRSFIQWFPSKVFEKNYKLKIEYGKKFDAVQNSKFCLGNLVKSWDRICNMNVHMELFSCDINHQKELFNSLRYKHPIHYLEFNLNWINNFGRSQIQWFKELSNRLLLLQEGESLLVFRTPLLTRFIVGFVYLIASCFEQIGLLDPLKYGYGIVFHNLKRKEFLLNDISELNEAIDEDKCIHSFVPIIKLTGGDFYKCVTEVNYEQLRQSCVREVAELIKNDSGI